MKAGTKFSEDVVPLSDLKVNPGRIVSQVDKTHRPVLLTSRGRGVRIGHGRMINLNMQHVRLSKSIILLFTVTYQNGRKNYENEMIRGVFGGNYVLVITTMALFPQKLFQQKYHFVPHFH